ncbi:MAG: uridine diphosphate-N-acetylglucosamine-binding protein YvcK [Firmicutes bacterium]|nr:uridine diphosphate-N-acetylglucosamine-binding protein YvcK [Bacillota bacterium]
MNGARGLHPDQPLRVAAIGGGTGLAALLRALQPEAGRARDPWRLTGIVAVSDNGGSSGRLREELGGIPPGDLRNCLSAMTREDSLLADLLSYRFKGEGPLAGHALGNLMLMALADLAGGWVRAIRQLSEVLAIEGRLFPSTLEPVALCAEDMEGRQYRGETEVNVCHPPLARLWLEPRDAEALAEALLAVMQADVVLLAPGSLYSSTLPNLLIPEFQRALARAQTPLIYVANLMTEPHESAGLNLEAHVASIQAFGGVGLAAVIANSEPLPEAMAERYRAEGGAPLLPLGEEVCGVPMKAVPLLDLEAPQARHDPGRLREALREVIAAL